MHSPGSKASASGLDSAHGYTGLHDKDEDFLSLWFNPGGYGRSSSGRYRRLQYYVRRAINRFVKIKQILCDWQTNIK